MAHFSYDSESFTTKSWNAESLVPVIGGVGGRRTLDKPRTMDKG